MGALVVQDIPEDDIEAQVRSRPGAETFEEVMNTLAVEIQVFCLLKTEANFGVQINYVNVLDALKEAEELEYLDPGATKAFQLSMEDQVRNMLRESGKVERGEAGEVVAKRAQEFLQTKVTLQPRVVMAVLSEMGIIEVNDAWKEFIQNADEVQQ